jgi:hypothetical protein
VSAFSQVRIADRTPTQLGLLERFHETLKYEEVYWHLYDDPADGRRKLADFHERYNGARPPWALVAANPAAAPGRILTPHEVYVKTLALSHHPHGPAESLAGPFAAGEQHAAGIT